MDTLLQLLKLLDDKGVAFVVIGGMAAIAHGSPVMTQDVDVCVSFDDENLPRILDALRPVRPRLRQRPDLMPLPDDPDRLRGIKNLYLVTDLGSIDLLGELPGVCSYSDLAHRSVEMDVGGFRCRVLDLDTLIEAKRVAARPKDRYALVHLEAIRDMLKKKGEAGSE